MKNRYMKQNTTKINLDLDKDTKTVNIQCLGMMILRGNKQHVSNI